MNKAEIKLEAIASRQPHQGQFATIKAFEKAYEGYKKQLRQFALDFPEYKEKITFSVRCVPCVGKKTLGECVKCNNFDGGNKKPDLFEMEILKPKNNNNMGKLSVFDITYTTPESKKRVFQVVLAETSDEAKSILLSSKEVSKIVEVNNLGKPLYKLK